MKQKILGRTYNIKHKQSVAHNGTECYGKVCHTDQEMEIARAHADVMGQTYWHEVIHVFDDTLKIHDDGKPLSESEVTRLAYSISTHLKELKR